MLYIIIAIMLGSLTISAFTSFRGFNRANRFQFLAAKQSHKAVTKKKAAPAKPTSAEKPAVTYTQPILYTENEFTEMLRKYRKVSATKCIEKMVAAYHTANKLSTNMTYTALKSVQTLNANSVGETVYKYWSSNIEQRQQELWMNPQPSIGIIKYFSRLGNMSTAATISKYFGIDQSVMLPFNTSLSPSDQLAIQQEVLNQLALGHAMQNQAKEALHYMNLLHQHDMCIVNDVSKKIMKQFLNEATSIHTILNCMRLLVNTAGLVDTEAIQLITNKFLSNMTFIKGAVSMDTLPSPALPEVMFMGRSNVGKSSLINMVTNKKNLAFTSKMAGKTTEFNYFEASGRVGGNKLTSLFHLVDVPGVGFAERSRGLRAKWVEFQRDYVQSRETLRCVFHLVDSRHGLLEADDECLDLLRVLPEYVNYVIVFTKIDKLRTSKRENMIKSEILAKVREAVEMRTNRQVPIIYSSSETRLGGTELLTTILERVHRT